MDAITFRNFIPSDTEKMVALQARCIHRCPYTGLFETGFRHAPGFHKEKNIIIATNNSGEVFGYAAINSAYYARNLNTQILWIDIRSDPTMYYYLELKDMLFRQIMVRGRDLIFEFDLDRAALGVTYFAEGKPALIFFINQGFSHFESVIAMRKDLTEHIPIKSLPNGIEIQECRLESLSVQEKFLAADQAAFGYQSWDIKGLQHLMQSKLWDSGTTITAFFNDQVISSLLTLSNGFLETVFTIPFWRQNGISRILISLALNFPYKQSRPLAWLEVLSHNNAPINLYKSLGFKVFKEEKSLGLLIE